MAAAASTHARLPLATAQLITFTDLEADYINPVDATDRINRFLLPEYVGQAVMTLLFLVTLNFIPAIANGALLAWHFKQYRERLHFVDATTVYPRLSQHKKHCIGKLIFYSLAFFYYLFRMVLAAVTVRRAMTGSKSPAG